MAKFDNLYPDQITGDINHSVEFEGSELFKYGNPKPCWNCGEPTSWIDLNFQAHLCSEECERVKWKEYEEACRKSTR